MNKRSGSLTVPYPIALARNRGRVAAIGVRAAAARTNRELQKNFRPSSSMENDMKSKFLTATAAFALTACTVVASSAPASAAWRGGWHGGWGGWGWPAAAAAGIVGGAVAAATSPLWAPGYYDYYPGYYGNPSYYGNPDYYGNPGYYGTSGYGPYYGSDYGYPPAVAVTPPGPEVAQGDTTAWCQARYRSYDPASGTYLGFDGIRHPCP